MRVGRTIPPAAAPVSAADLIRGLAGMVTAGTTRKLENEIRENFGTEYVFLVSSGKAALALVLKGLASLKSRRKVLIPAYTCYSVPSAVLRSGLEISLCDVDPHTLDFDYLQLERLADEDTLCIVSTHLFGIPSDMDRARRICEKKGIFLVEDAAQAMGGEEGGRKLGALGDIGFFSLGRGKNITCGSGGIILTSSKEIGKSIRECYRGLAAEPAVEQIREVLQSAFTAIFLNPNFYWLPDGLPFLRIGETRYYRDFPIYRMSGFKAGILGSWKTRLQEYNRARRINGSRYEQRFSLGGNRKIYSGDTPFLRFPFYMNTREDKEAACGRYRYLGVSPMYPDSLNRVDEIRNHIPDLECPGAEQVAETLLTLPTHVLLTERDREKICLGIESMSRVMEPGEAATWRDRCEAGKAGRWER